MKKLLGVSLICLSASLLAASVFSSIKSPLLVSAGESSVADIPAWNYISGWEISQKYTSSGVEATVPGASSVSGDAWKYAAEIGTSDLVKPFLNLDYVDEIALSFSVVFYSDDGNTVISKSVNGSSFDFIVYIGETPIERLRCWTDSGSYTNGNHSYDLIIGDGDSDGWAKAGKSYWIKGNATESSSFTLKFDKTNLLQSEAGGQDGFVSLHDGDTIPNKATAALANSSQVSFKIRGDGGFTNDTRVILRSINGQSLATTDSKFTDNEGPMFNKSEITTETEFYKGFIYEINSSLEAYDLFGTPVISTSIDGTSYTPGHNFAFDEAGKKTIYVKATDLAGNETIISKEVEVKEVTTASVFAKWMMQEHSESCEAKYKKAKEMLLSLSEDEIDTFKTSSDENIAAARERYQAWCIANNDSSLYSGPVVANANPLGLAFSNTESVVTITIASIAAASFALALALIIRKKKKSN